MNVFNFTGNLGNDAEVRNVGSGTVCSFSVAFKSGYGDREKTTWARCNLWGKRAEGKLPCYLSKGTQVAVSGEISLNVYTNKDGAEKTSLEVNVNDIDLIGGKSERPEPPQRQPAQQNLPDEGFDQMEPDVPF